MLTKLFLLLIMIVPDLGLYGYYQQSAFRQYQYQAYVQQRAKNHARYMQRRELLRAKLQYDAKIKQANGKQPAQLPNCLER